MISISKSPDKEINKLLRLATYKILLWYGITIFTIILVTSSFDSSDAIYKYVLFILIFGFIDGLFLPSISMNIKNSISNFAETSGFFLFPIFISILTFFFMRESIESWLPIGFTLIMLFLFLFSFAIPFWMITFHLGVLVNGALIQLFFKDSGLYFKDLLETEKRNKERLESIIQNNPTITQLKECYDKQEYELGLKKFEGLVSFRDLNFLYENLSEIMKIPENFISKYNEVEPNSVDNLIEEIIAINQNSCPELNIKFPEKEINPDEWNRVNLIISNDGNSFAYGINIEFSDGLKISGLPEDIRIKTDPVSMAVSLKPIGSGDIAVDYSISAKYKKMFFDSNEKRIETYYREKDYIKKGTFWLEIPKNESSKGRIHISGSNVKLNNNVNITDSVINRSNINSRELFPNTTEGSEDISIDDSIVNRSIIGGKNEN